MLEIDLVKHYPVVFHLTRTGAWPLIEKHGLLSVKAICELQCLTSEQIQQHLRQHRPATVKLGRFALRDQKPLRQHNLKRNLQDSGLNPEDWHELLNERVFFSTKPEFVDRLRNSYLNDAVTILAMDTAALLQQHRRVIELTRYNSGAARMPNHRKSRDSLLSIERFPFSPACKPKELTVRHSVPRIKQALVEVRNLSPREPFLNRAGLPVHGSKMYS